MSVPSTLSALSPTTWPFSLDLLPQPVHLVGGAVRDALLERRADYLDLDFIIPTDAVATASSIAKRYQAGFVILDAERQIARVVFEGATADFAQQEGNSLEADLRRRDYTINAIAYDPRDRAWIDPLNGMKDVRKRLIRMVSKANLQDDPLRLLRAYRQAAQLDFSIHSRTRAALRQLAPQLQTVAAERVRVELGYLLGCAEGGKWLKEAWEDGLFDFWLEGTQQENFEQIKQVEQCAWLLGRIWQELDRLLDEKLTLQALSWESLAKLACLVSSDPAIAQAQLEKLKYSRSEIRAVTVAIKHLPRLLRSRDVPLNLREQYHLFQEVDRAFPMLGLLTVAVAAQKGILQETTAVGTIAPLINRYLDPHDLVAHPQPLISGTELMAALQLSPSPAIGKLLLEIQIAAIEGRISTPKEALDFAATLLN
ncbi:CCA tRNA nucleotidyltransferase [Oscillatoria sp. FACHB-1406]|uniref:CCA tRNA nucleotidyltransferase n=1 Tax=Oscillatoria sp. FACHB-1406 TaxID=2692846 RepID=UPI0016846E02|nr:CCA tRNA nucleotidyltransferase [Oscillatoria sp. FACHB-1406]MBD2578001.1 CCA tRNA nucleotidyltransferase [Oscillatoria sp. FACHB-1406]